MTTTLTAESTADEVTTVSAGRGAGRVERRGSLTGPAKASASRAEATVVRNHQLDLLRIGFALLVMLAHASELRDGNASREPLHWLTHLHSDFNAGSVGVDGFFLLSGALITQSWQRNAQLWTYLRKRLLRIVPGYLVAAVLSTVMVGLMAPGVDHFFEHLTPHYPESLLLLGEPATPPVFPGMPRHVVNGSLWTIPYEFRCYLLVPLLGLLGFLRRPVLWLVLTLAMLVPLAFPQVLGTYSWHKLYFLTGEPIPATRLTATFLVGACFSLFRERIRFRPGAAALAGIGLMAALLLIPVYFEPVLVLCGGYLLFYLAQRQIPALAWARAVPDVSYGVYLYGGPVEALWIWYHPGQSPWVTFVAAVPICLALGWLSWHLVERPMLRLKRRPSAQQQPA